MIPVFFHPRQLDHKPCYEWTFGEKIAHPETTDRAERIVAAIGKRRAFEMRAPKEIPLDAIRAVHDERLIDLYRLAESIEGTFYPSVFPQRLGEAPDPVDVRRAGWFCFDSGTPLAATTWDAARLSAACAWAAADAVEGGAPLAYGLCRPPGHHASHNMFGGYCYFNNAAIVANRLRAKGKVAIVDVDFHHGNGTQAIFWRDPEVFFASLHGDPEEFYPYFTGREEEIGEGAGRGTTMNVPLPRGCCGEQYLACLDRVLEAVARFSPRVLIVSAGLDTFREDPIGSFHLDTPDLHAIGARLGRLGLPTVALQEGGYCTEHLGENAVAMLEGIRDGQATRGRA